VDLREALERHGVAADAEEPLRRLLEALAAEPDPQTTVAPDDAVDVHIADSLAGLGFDELRIAKRIADVGAGAGFPGLPLAVALPQAQVDLVEASQRKVALIGRLIEAAGIQNARPVHARAEEWAADEGGEAYEAVCFRAVAALPVLVEYAAPLLTEGGAMVAWKGLRDSEEEAAGARAAEELGFAATAIRAVEPYPGSRDRHLHLYRKVSPTPAGFPRRPGMAAKRPLG
jgi:16S rRNA (guanine527-N7)-methyltransferase